MRILFKEPGKDPRQMQIPNTLSVLQQLVDGYIETLTVADDVVLIFNEEGKLRGFEPNFFVGAIQDVIVGPVIVAGRDEEGEIASLTEKNAEFIGAIMRGGFDI